MSDPTLTCPECGTEIKLNESLAGPLLAEARGEFAEKLRQKNAEMADAQAKLHAEKAALGAKLKRGVEDARAEIAREEAKKANLKAAEKIARQSQITKSLEDAIRHQEEELEKSHTEQAELMRKKREMEEKLRKSDLIVERRVQEGLDVARAQAKAEQESEYHLKLRESEQKNATLTKQITEWKRRAEQGSQQHQGEVLETAIESLLAKNFIHDEIIPVQKGVSGADILQRVMSPNGKFCGTILWETKRTKAWHATWLPKLKDDQRKCNADIAVLMSTTLPKEMEPGSFGQIDGVWVTGYDSALSMGGALRISLIQVANVLAVRDGQASKAELVYDYLTGTKFRHRIEAIVEKFDDMRGDLEREKKVTQKNWAKREGQIDAVISSTLGMHGDLQAIAGSSMPEIGGLEDEVPLLDEG